MYAGGAELVIKYVHVGVVNGRFLAAIKGHGARGSIFFSHRNLLDSARHLLLYRLPGDSDLRRGNMRMHVGKG